MRQSESERPCVSRAFTNTNTPDRSLMEAGSGNISIEKHTVFPGIWIETIEAYAPSFCLCHAYSNRCIRITHCGKGCLEYEGPDRVLSLHQGDLNIPVCMPTGILLRTLHHSGSGGRAPMRLLPAGRCGDRPAPSVPAAAPRGSALSFAGDGAVETCFLGTL